MIRKAFDQSGDFAACYAAEEWCEANDISVGRMQGPDPRGLMYGAHDIMKWRNLDKSDIAELDGRMTGSMRNGPVVVEIRERSK